MNYQVKLQIQSQTIAFRVLFFAALIFAYASVVTANPILGSYPDTSLPLSGDTTVIPDVAPANTASITVATSINFKGTFIAERATGIVRVTNAYPAGIYKVTLTAFDKAGATKISRFRLTVTTPETCLPVNFAEAINYSFGRYPYPLVVGDFDSDGNQDLAVGNIDGPSGGLGILFGDGAGNFGPAQVSLIEQSGLSIAVGDFNGDGRQDLVVVGELGGAAILLGKGQRTFADPVFFTTGFGGGGVKVGDFNGDGKQDLAVHIGGYPAPVSILLGNGRGKFGPPTLFDASYNAAGIVLGDFNKDGAQDIAVNGQSPDDVRILLGDGHGAFGAPKIFPLADPGPLAVGDFNRDGNEDLAITSYVPLTPSTLSIMLGNGDGNFSAPVTTTLTYAATSIAVGDFNGDGIEDLALSNYTTNSLSILVGDGTGNFNAALDLAVGSQPNQIAVGDFNGDGLQDLAVANGASRTVSVLVRACTMNP